MTTISALGSSSYAALDTEIETEPLHHLGIAGEIALLMLEHEDSQEESDRTTRNLARSVRREAAAEEVDALMDSADALEAGAWAAGAAAVVGGGVSVVGGVMAFRADCPRDLGKADVVKTTGAMLSQLGKPLDSIIGQAPSQHAQAEAKDAAFDGEQASWRIDDASQHLDKVDRNRDRVLEALESINQSEAAADNAVVQNV